MSEPTPIPDADLLAFLDNEEEASSVAIAPYYAALRSRLLALQRVEQLPAQWSQQSFMASQALEFGESGAYSECAADLREALASPTRPEGRRDDR